MSQIAEPGASECPVCGTMISPTLFKCPKCQHLRVLEAELLPEPKRPMLDRPWMLIVLILHLGVLGIPVYWRSPYSATIRVAMIAVSTIYTVLAVTVIYWGIQQVLSAWRTV